MRGPKLLWLALVLAMTAFLGYLAAGGFPLETNILKLLPETQTDPVTEEAYRQFELATGRKTVFMVGAVDVSKAKTGAEKLYKAMEASGLFSEISYRVDPDRARKTYEVYEPHRQSLLSDEERRYLLAGKPQLLVSQAAKTLMSPVSMGSSAGLAADPLFTFREFLKELQAQAGAFSISEDVLVASHGDKHYVILVGVLQDNAFSVRAQGRFQAFYSQAKAEVQQDPQVQLLSAGVIHHAIAGTNSARQDISTIGVGSIAGVFLLMFIAFRSIGPLFVSALPVLVGFVAALFVCVLVFGKVHLFTLVFGSSLVGVSIDYAFHFLAERLSAGERWNPSEGLKHIFAGITLGLITSLAAYLALAIAPFTGLRQIAVFSVVGLTGAYLTVVLWFPALLKKPSAEATPITLRLSKAFIRAWSKWAPEDPRSPAPSPARLGGPKKFLLGFLVVFLALTWYLAGHLKVDDNIRSLQSSPQSIVQEENLVKDIVGTSSGTQFFVLRGTSEDQVLSLEEQLTQDLDGEQQKGHIKRYRAITKVLPSASRQQQNYQLMRAQVLDPKSAVSQYLADMGFDDDVVANFRHSYQPTRQDPLTVEAWLRSPLRELYQPLWIAHPEESVYASIVILDGVTNLDAMRETAERLPGVAFVSRADDISALLQTYRRLSSWLVAGAYCSIFLMLLARYRMENAFAVMVAPVGAGLAALAVTAAAGISLNLFNTLALIIVLGIGIDYTIFFAERPSDRGVTMHAVFLSAVTTILSFGLLALSGTPVIASFGLMVFVGILVSVLLAPLVGL